jgi:hypothetical protein
MFMPSSPYGITSRPQSLLSDPSMYVDPSSPRFCEATRGLYGDITIKSRGRAEVLRGFPAGANRGILAGMSWHRTPTDDAWKQAHLAMVEGLGKRLWLGCD